MTPNFTVAILFALLALFHGCTCHEQNSEKALKSYSTIGFKTGELSYSSLRSRLNHLGVTVDQSTLSPIPDYAYASRWINLALGTPSQGFKLLLDSLSAEFWVPSRKCKSSACSKHKTYDSTASTSYKPDGSNASVEYVKGSIKGIISRDVVNILARSPKVPFIEVTELSDDTFTDAVFDGMLGMNLNALSETSKNPIALYIRSSRAPMIISLRNYRNQTKNPGGEIALGGYLPDVSYVGPITYAPLTHKVYWQFKLDDVAVAGSNALAGTCTQGCQAIADTGSSLIYGPAEAVQKLNKAIGATKTRDGAWLLRSCDEDQLPNVVFTVAGNPLPMSATTYVIEEKEGDKKSCYSSFVEVTGSDSRWILGGKFAGEEYLTVFDARSRRVGFALNK